MRKYILCPVIIALAAALMFGCGKKNAEVEPDTEETSLEEDSEEDDEDSLPDVIVIEDTEGIQTTGTQGDKNSEAEAETAPDLSKLVTGSIYTMDSVNIRKAPSTEAEVVIQTEPDTELMLIGAENEEWTQILYEDEICYVASAFVTEDKDWRANLRTKNGYADGDAVGLDPSWTYADFSEIHSGNAVMYVATSNRKNKIIGVNAGHGTEGGTNSKTWSHPDKTPKITGGTTAAGADKTMCVSTGMNFKDGTREANVTLREAQIFRDLLLAEGYDVLMIRDGEDVQLDNVARTIICNNAADCHIAIHWDGDGLDYDKGCFYMSVPDGLKYMAPVSDTWQASEALGDAVISGLKDRGCKIFGDGTMDMDLTQTSYSSVASIDIELGNAASDHSEEVLYKLAEGMVKGINMYFGF